MEIHKPVMINASVLRAARYNPRKLSKRMLAALVESIRRNGFVEPMVVQRTTNVIIGGHQRLEALRVLCREEGKSLPRIPAVVLDLDDRAAKLLNLALNRVSGEFDDDMLSEMIAGVQEEGGVLSTEEVLGSGFTQQEIDAMLAPPEDDADGEGDGVTAFARSVTLSVRFDTVEERDAAQALLNELVAKKNGKPGTVLLALLRA